MDKYARYIGLIPFVVLIAVVALLISFVVIPKYNASVEVHSSLSNVESELQKKQQDKQNVENKKKKLKDANMNAQKKVYSPLESDMGNDSLFFNMYNDVLEMLNANSIKIKTMEYVYNPEGDPFVSSGKDYFVCDINMQLISNFVNMGKFIQDIYQYPYYVKINYVDIKPYQKDKKVLITYLGLRLYAHTQPVQDNNY